MQATGRPRRHAPNSHQQCGSERDRQHADETAGNDTEEGSVDAHVLNPRDVDETDDGTDGHEVCREQIRRVGRDERTDLVCAALDEHRNPEQERAQKRVGRVHAVVAADDTAKHPWGRHVHGEPSRLTDLFALGRRVDQLLQLFEFGIEGRDFGLVVWRRFLLNTGVVGYSSAGSSGTCSRAGMSGFARAGSVGSPFSQT